MKTADQIAAEASERVRERFKIDAVAALHGSLQSIIRAAIEEALAERPDGMKSGGVQRMDEQLHPTSIPPQMP